MFWCILGERKSGKSVFVENRVKKTDNKALYIATLPELKMYKEIINAHQKRRPSSWECVELLEMSAEEILTYPYQKYQNVILDNLSYYALFQLCYNKEEFIKKCDERVLALIDRIAADSATTLYFIDTPINQDMFEHEDKNGVIRQLFARILDKAGVIERFYSGGTVCRPTVEEGKKYLFRT